MALPIHCFQVELEFRMWVFVEGGKPEDPEKTLGTRTGINNKLNPHLTLGMKINLGPQQC